MRKRQMHVIKEPRDLVHDSFNSIPCCLNRCNDCTLDPVPNRYRCRFDSIKNRRKCILQSLKYGRHLAFNAVNDRADCGFDSIPHRNRYRFYCIEYRGYH